MASILQLTEAGNAIKELIEKWWDWRTAPQGDGGPCDVSRQNGLGSILALPRGCTLDDVLKSSGPPMMGVIGVGPGNFDKVANSGLTYLEINGLGTLFGGGVQGAASVLARLKAGEIIGLPAGVTTQSLTRLDTFK
jgi:hypothetical protein